MGMIFLGRWQQLSRDFVGLAYALEDMRNRI
jgi:hypothetical protein